MDLNQYQIAAARTINPSLTHRDHLTNAVFGLAGESGELIDHIKKLLFHGHELNRAAVINEAGDQLWYLAYLLSELNISLDDVAQANISKLQQRYPDRFSAEHSRNRIEGLG